MSQIDFTPALSDAYERLLQEEQAAAAALNAKAAEILRELEADDIYYAVIQDNADAIRDAVIAGDRETLGLIIYTGIKDYCHRVAKRVIES